MTKQIIMISLVALLFCSQVWAEVKKIEGTTNLDDAMIRSGAADNNYGDMGNDDFTIQAATYFALIRVKNVASELGENATISACICSIYCSSEQLGAKWLRTYRVFKPWVEGDENGVDNDDGDVTWNDWASDEYEWTTAGCGSADDGGSDNSGDGTGADRKATQESAQSVNATGWFGFTISAELAQDWYDGSANENGILLWTDSNGSSQWRGTEAVTNQPFFVFTYTTEGATAASPRRRMIPIIIEGGE